MVTILSLVLQSTMQIQPLVVLDYRKFKLDIKLSFRLISGDTYLETSLPGLSPRCTWHLTASPQGNFTVSGASNYARDSHSLPVFSLNYGGSKNYIIEG